MSLFSKVLKTHNYKIQEIPNSSDNEGAASLNEAKASNNEEIVAAIMGALTAMMSHDAITDIKIKTIRRIGRTSPVWNIAGRDEYLASKL